MKGTLFRRIAKLLLVVMVVQVAFGNYAYAQESTGIGEYSSEFYGKDGSKYLLEMKADCIESYTMTITNLETLDKEILDYDYGIVDYSEYEYVGKNWFGKDKYSCKSVCVNIGFHFSTLHAC